METVKPCYYSKFKCIADKCRHSCCIGWEIDIDENTLEFYKAQKGEIGDKLKENISYENTPHFILGEKERCPFLMENGLCELYIKLGEENLCDICTLHPRFINYLTDRKEIGLGLCCEEAVRIILSEEEKFTLTKEGSREENLSEDETEILKLRDLCIHTLENKRKSLKERLINMLSLSDYCEVPELDINFWAKEYLNLEMLSENWGGTLNKLIKTDANLGFEEVFNEFENEFKNLAIYFIYRHLIKAAEDFCTAEYLQFTFISLFIIASILALIKEEKGEITKEDLFETVRTYSSEIEYSDDNTYALLDILAE